MTISLPEQSPQQRRTARIAGWLMASTFLTSIPAALILYDPVLNDTGYILGGFARQAGAPDVGKFTLTLRKDETGRWLILSDMDSANSRP